MEEIKPFLRIDAHVAVMEMPTNLSKQGSLSAGCWGDE